MADDTPKATDNSDAPANIPSIAINSESTQNIANHLSPTSVSPQQTASPPLEVEPPTIDDEPFIIPPSPTISTRSSLHFNATTGLRDNEPDHYSDRRKLSNPDFVQDTAVDDPLDSTIPQYSTASPPDRVSANLPDDATPPPSYVPSDRESPPNHVPA